MGKLVKIGGFNFKYFVIWNTTAVMKQLWVIDKVKNRLWLKWMHAYYTKGKDVFQTKVPTTATSMVSI